LLDGRGRLPVRALVALLLCAAAGPARAEQAASPRPAPQTRHKVVIAPLATLGAESTAADVKAAQRLVARGLTSLGSVDLVEHAAMLDAIKKAKRPELRSCDGDPPCLAGLGKLVGARYAVFGEVGGLGEAKVVYLKLIDVNAAREVRSTVLELGGAQTSDLEARAAATRLIAPGRYVGQIALTSNVKGASVYIDGERVARTPARPLTLAVGAHALRVTHPEFRDFVRFVEVGFGAVEEIPVDLAPYDAVAGDIRRTRQGDPIVGPGGVAPTPWYRRWYTVAGGAAVLFLTSAIVIGVAADRIDFDREKQVP
jgi:hypothetical protein